MKYISLSIVFLATLLSLLLVPPVFATPGEGKGVVKICLAGQTWTTCAKDTVPQAEGDIYIRRFEFGRPDKSLPSIWQEEANIYVKAEKANGKYTMSNWENNFVLASQRRSISKRNDFMCTVYSPLEEGSPKDVTTGQYNENWCGFSSDQNGYRLQASFSPNFKLPKKYVDAGYSHTKGHWKIMNNQGSFIDRAEYNTKENGDRRVGDGGSISTYHFMFVLDSPQPTLTTTPSPTVAPQATPTSEAIPVSAVTDVLACPSNLPTAKDVFTPGSSIDIADSNKVNHPLQNPVGVVGKPIILASGNCSAKGTVITAGPEEGQCNFTVTWTTNDTKYAHPYVTCNSSLSMKIRPIPVCTAPSGHAKIVYPGDSFEVLKGSAIHTEGKPVISTSPSTTCAYDAETNKIKVSAEAVGDESCTYRSTWSGVEYATPNTVSCETTFDVSAPIRILKLKPILTCADDLITRPGNLTLAFDKKTTASGPDKDGVYSVSLSGKDTVHIAEAKSGSDTVNIVKTSQRDFTYDDAKDTTVRTVALSTDNASICVPGTKTVKVKPLFGCANGKVMTISPLVQFLGTQPVSSTPDSQGYYSIILTIDDPTVTITSSLSGIALIPGDANTFNHASAVAPYEYTVRFASTNANVCGSAPVRSICRAEKCVNANASPIINTPHTVAEGLRKSLLQDTTHPLHVQPFLDPGETDESNARSFTLTNSGRAGEQVGDKEVHIRYFLDCLSDDGTSTDTNRLSQLPCQDKKGEATLAPYQDITLGLGAVCSEWQLGVRYSYNPDDPALQQDFNKQSPNDTGLIVRSVARDEARCAQCSSFRCVPVAGDLPDTCSSDVTCAVTVKPKINFDLPPAVCEYESNQLKIPGTVTLPDGTSAKLKLGYKIIAPDSLRTDEIITTFNASQVKNESPFVFEVQWPGIRAVDTLVDVRISGYLYDIDTGLPLLTHPTNVHLRWQPSTDCPKPEAKSPSLTHRKKITNIHKEKGDSDHYIVSYTGYVLNDGNVPINQVRLEEFIKTANAEVLHLLTNQSSVTTGSQMILDSHSLQPGQAIGYTVAVRVNALEMSQICTEQTSMGMYDGLLIAPDPSASCANIISSVSNLLTVSNEESPIFVASRANGDVQGVTDTTTSTPQINLKMRTMILFTIGCGLLLGAIAVEESRLHTKTHRMMREDD